MLNIRTCCASKMVAVLLGATFLGGGQVRADILHQDDVIIFFSLCVGTDCVNGENFGFDTIRLKENNLRIHFDDTSNSASFPANDWRLIANDTNNGGGNFFAIEDATAGRQVFRVDAGAPANSLRVNSSGNVGIGTATPGSLELNIVDGDTPTVRLAQDGSSGFQAQTWDIAGNETNFFVRNVTNGSRLPFRVFPDFRADGIVGRGENVGFGVTVPVATLHAKSSGDTALRLDAPGAQWQLLVNSASGRVVLQDLISGNSPFRIVSGAPSNALEVSNNNLRFSQYPNCAQLSTNANGFLQCLAAPPSPSPLTAADSAPVGYTSATPTLASQSASSVSSGGATTSSTDGSRTGVIEGCDAGDLAGEWSLIGTGPQEIGDNSVLWCDLRLTNRQRALTYSVSGVCRSHGPDGLNTQVAELVAQGMVTENAACQFGGSLKIKQRGAVLTNLTIIEGRIEARGAKKTRAIGLSRLTRGHVRTLQTLVMQR